MPRRLPLQPEDAAWAARARPLEAFLCDALFRLDADVYVGAANNLRPGEWERARIPVPPPDLRQCLPGWVASADLLGHEARLAAHHRARRAVAAAHGRPLPAPTIRPAIIAAGEVLASFPWTDTGAETAAILRILAAPHPAEGVILDEEDQGWRLRLIALGGRLHLAEWDAEQPLPDGEAWSMDAATLSSLAAAALARLGTILGRLARDDGTGEGTALSGPLPPRA